MDRKFIERKIRALPDDSLWRLLLIRHPANGERWEKSNEVRVMAFRVVR